MNEKYENISFCKKDKLYNALKSIYSRSGVKIEDILRHL